MDVGAVNGSRAAVQTAAAHEGDLERRPILAARTGPLPMSAFVRGPAQDEILRATLRGRAALHDLDPVLAKPAAEEPGQGGAPAAVQAALLLEPEAARAKRESGQARADEAAVERTSPIGQLHARSRFSQAGAVDAASSEDLVARFADAAGPRQARGG
jgi:hypothetical protein